MTGNLEMFYNMFENFEWKTLVQFVLYSLDEQIQRTGYIIWYNMLGYSA